MKRHSWIIICVVFWMACEDKVVADDPFPEGTYSGEFFRVHPSIDYPRSTVTLSFSRGTFTGESQFTKYPAICHGTYTVTGSTISFENTCAFTAEFDWTLILAGTFQFELNGDHLTLTKNQGDAHDNYALMPQ